MAALERIDWRAARGELTALASLALRLPLRWWIPTESFDPAAPHPTPVVFVHGLLGDPTNFLTLRAFLAAHGVRNFASFSYGPRIDHQHLAPCLGRTLDAVCEATGAARVDVIGHSLGGLVARYLLAIGAGRRVRRLVTLGAPYFTGRLPPQELAVFGAGDLLVPAPHPAHGPHGRVRVITDCGHLGLLYHPAVLRAVTDYLTCRGTTTAAPTRLPWRHRDAGPRRPGPWMVVRDPRRRSLAGHAPAVVAARGQGAS